MGPSDRGEGGRRRLGDLTLRFRTSGVQPAAEAGGPSLSTKPLQQPLATRRMLPVRYQIKEDTAGRFLTCTEATNIVVRIERGMSVAGASARKYPKGTIFVDGAAQSEPFLDSSRAIYNLDHHEGCVRAFTLAACEQAMVLVRKGLDLDGERWTVYANEPDLDTVLAVWLLLNHRRIDADDPAIRSRMMPIIRLQGVIDAHGLELIELTAFPDEMQRSTLAIIDELRSEELELKREGRWSSIDPLEVTIASLQQIDELVYTPLDFEDLREIEELARDWIAPNRIALACRSEAGIYEVEEHLRTVHGERLGILILQKDARTYTVRQVDPFLPNNLEPLYARLNLFDRAATGDTRWGGSTDIGGSPRGVGTALSLEAIMGVCRWVFQPHPLGRRLVTVVFAVAMALLAMAIAAVAAGGFEVLVRPGSLAGLSPQRYALGAVVLAVLSVGMSVLASQRLPGQFGLRRPSGIGFLSVLPVAAALSVAGAVWSPTFDSEFATASGWLVPIAIAAGAVGVELALRGMLHGLLASQFSIMLDSGRRFISLPVAVSALVYAGATIVCCQSPVWLASWRITSRHAAWAGAVFLFGLAMGLVRERWGSVWAPVVVHAITAIGLWGAVFAL